MKIKKHKGCRGVVESFSLLSYPPIHIERCNKCGKELSRVKEKITIEEVE